MSQSGFILSATHTCEVTHKLYMLIKSIDLCKYTCSKFSFDLGKCSSVQGSQGLSFSTTTT